MLIRIATAKVPKWGLSVSGDTVDVVERPRGGMTAVLADGQGHGPGANRTSRMVVNRTVTLLADGARDGAVARAVHDFLHASREGKVSADLTLLSVDLYSRTLVVSRNANTPVLVRHANGRVEILSQAAGPIGVYAMAKPAVMEWPIESDCILLAMSDGVWEAGRRSGRRLEPEELIRLTAKGQSRDAQGLADAALALAMACDDGRPQDDMTVLVVALDPAEDPELVRRLNVIIPG